MTRLRTLVFLSGIQKSKDRAWIFVPFGVGFVAMTQIDLREIPDEGMSYEFSDKDRKLDDLIYPLNEGNSYELQLHIVPIGDGFEARGSLKTGIPKTCSRCGALYVETQGLKIHEILIEKLEQPRGSSYSKPNHFSDLEDTAPSITLVEDEIFDLNQLLIDYIGLESAGNIKNLCGGEICKTYGETPYDYDEEMDSQQSPFDELKKLLN